jgi:hypothetical protein
LKAGKIRLGCAAVVGNPAELTWGVNEAVVSVFCWDMRLVQESKRTIGIDSRIVYTKNQVDFQST